MLKLIKIFALIVIATLIDAHLALSSGQSSQQTKFNIGSGSIDNIYWNFAVDIQKMTKKHEFKKQLDEIAIISPIISTGSHKNMSDLCNQVIDSAFVQEDILYDHLIGDDYKYEFECRNEIELVRLLYTEKLHIVSKAEYAENRNFSDLEGKTIAIPEGRSGTQQIAQYLKKLFGVTVLMEDDGYKNFEEALRWLDDDIIQASVEFVGEGSSRYKNLPEGYVLLEILHESLNDRFFYKPATISLGKNNDGQEVYVNTYGVRAAWMVNSSSKNSPNYCSVSRAEDAVAAFLPQIKPDEEGNLQVPKGYFELWKETKELDGVALPFFDIVSFDRRC